MTNRSWVGGADFTDASGCKRSTTWPLVRLYVDDRGGRLHLSATSGIWVAASVCVAMIVVYSFTESMGAWLSWMRGISLLAVMVCSGAIAWIEFRSNPTEDAERGEWTNKMLFYGLVFAGTFFVAFLYWLSLYFTR